MKYRDLKRKQKSLMLAARIRFTHKCLMKMALNNVLTGDRIASTAERLKNLNHMKTLIDNNSRIFMLTGDMGKTLICNIEDLEKCFNYFDDKDAIKIQHKWNARFIRCSKKSIIDMLKSLNLDHGFISFEYKFKFTGRKIGAIGKFYAIKHTVKAKNYDSAIKTLYKSFEHITNLTQY